MVLSVSAVKYRKNVSLREGLLPSKFFALYFFNLVTVDAVFSEIDFQGYQGYQSTHTDGIVISYVYHFLKEKKRKPITEKICRNHFVLNNKKLS